ncbi:WAT1-related protein At5g40230 [Jatropha curcas]|uniref:WAT1-related protein At5g40230 n=1 Tax=Jatropha curcas TaxID=180498 RepID=UPI001893E977|nr:WAT1-related protein At5g40230 [Jatropha curcas]
MGPRFLYGDLLPFIAMVSVECTIVGASTLFKAASSKGMSCYVFIVYSYAISTLVLLPVPFIFYSAAAEIKLPLLCRIFVLALIGFLSMIVGTKGVEYSSPTLSSAMSNLTPAFTFAFAFLFRMEKVAMRRSSSQAKIAGTIVSIAGALVVLFYKENLICKTSNMDLLAILYSGIFAQSYSTVIHSWGLRLKGPLYVTIFRPLSIAIAAFMGVLFLGDALHLGIVIGSIIIALGFYSVMWGQMKEKNNETFSSHEAPLLQRNASFREDN